MYVYNEYRSECKYFTIVNAARTVMTKPTCVVNLFQFCCSKIGGRKESRTGKYMYAALSYDSLLILELPYLG